jgi:hypothetical protein
VSVWVLLTCDPEALIRGRIMIRSRGENIIMTDPTSASYLCFPYWRFKKFRYSLVESKAVCKVIANDHYCGSIEI